MSTVITPVGLKLGVVGKGGVGKTTVSGLLARAYADRWSRVVAIDTDSNPNLGLSLGLTHGDRGGTGAATCGDRRLRRRWPQRRRAD